MFLYGFPRGNPYKNIMKQFVKGDLDGFFALGLDNLIMFLLMSNLCFNRFGFNSPKLASFLIHKV